jgi:hypothetical protein
MWVKYVIYFSVNKVLTDLSSSVVGMREHQNFESVFRIRIHMFLGLPDPDPLVRGMDPEPSISKQK